MLPFKFLSTNLQTRQAAVAAVEAAAVAALVGGVAAGKAKVVVPVVPEQMLETVATPEVWEMGAEAADLVGSRESIKNILW